MKIPNHSLFNEKICNLAESGGCVYAVDIHFPLAPDHASSQVLYTVYILSRFRTNFNFKIMNLWYVVLHLGKDRRIL